MTFSELMRRIGLTDAELAKRMGVARMTAYRWNRTLVLPIPDRRKALAKRAGVPIAEVTWERAK